MAAPTPSEIFQSAAKEGQRRLDQSLLELVSTSFIAGFTIIFGIVAQSIAHAAVEPRWGEVASLAGGLAFAVGLVFLIVGRAELFTENFFDPVATAFSRRKGALLPRILRLWGITFVLNFVGGVLFALVVSVPGVLPSGAEDSLSRMAEELAAREPWAGLASAVFGGALVALLSYMLRGSDSTASRIAVAYLVGFLLAAGPFHHVVVTGLHVFTGILFGASVSYGALAEIVGIAAAGNLVGGVGLVTLSHVAQAKAAQGGHGSEG